MDLICIWFDAEHNCGLDLERIVALWTAYNAGVQRYLIRIVDYFLRASTNNFTVLVPRRIRCWIVPALIMILYRHHIRILLVYRVPLLSKLFGTCSSILVIRCRVVWFLLMDLEVWHQLTHILILITQLNPRSTHNIIWLFPSQPLSFWFLMWLFDVWNIGWWCSIGQNTHAIIRKMIVRWVLQMLGQLNLGLAASSNVSSGSVRPIDLQWFIILLI